MPVQRSLPLLRPATNPLHAPLRRYRPGPKAQAWRCVRFWGQREVHSVCRACLAAMQPHPAAGRSHLVQGINRLGKGTAKPGTLRPTDPNRFKTEDFFSVEAEGDPEYLRRIVEVRDPQTPALQLACSSCACALPAMCLFTRLASGVHTWSGWVQVEQLAANKQGAVLARGGALRARPAWHVAARPGALVSKESFVT